ncbi:hypothetical protein [Kutzneria buriramensis]|uniref:Glycoside hydrolase family 42 N-terminal domain-containing protein n=1 Tax=Kutzneria buriramensis TaxID=1045776 RepID=A0A3E0GT05_9PSEU|nr:hypothetical protein [Kutzneria buriramensis]REH26202.1 hypothetical protein BCF44_13457 [Kutzneria buriramensis]
MTDARRSRRWLFRAAGVGAAALAAPTVAGATPRPATPAVTPMQLGNACNSTPLLDDPRFPIGVFWPPPPDQSTAANYADMAGAGFTFLITGNYQLDWQSIDYALGLADQYGMKALVATDPGVKAVGEMFTIDDSRSDPLTISTAGARTLVQTATARYSRHQSFAGFSLYDEPDLGGSRNVTLGRATRVVHEMAPSAMAYINLSYAVGLDYPKVLKDFISQVAPPLLSFDYYPLRTTGEAEDYFLCWSQIRQAGLDSGLPTWTYVQTLPSGIFPQPTAADLAWQVNVSLAYGCKGIQYFTYWTPDPARGEGFGPALIDLNGAKTDRYAASQALNHTWLAPVGKELLPLVSESVVHANENPQTNGTNPFTPDGYLTSVAGTVVLGRFRSADSSVKDRWVFVANRSNTASVDVMLTTDTAAVHGVGRFDPSTGGYTPQSDAPCIAVSLDAGAAALYKLSAS